MFVKSQSFVPGKLFQVSLSFAGKARVYPSEALACLPGTKTLAYYKNLNYGQKSFITLTQGANVIKLFTAVSYAFYNKLERLSLASFTHKV